MLQGFVHCEKFGGMRECILTFEYDTKITIPLMIMCFEQLNPNIVVVFTTTHDVRLELEENIYVEWGPQLRNIF
jgi:hypothetical protein